MTEPENRTAIISAIKTPLAFIVFIVLVAEGILGTITGLSSGSDRSAPLDAMIGLLILAFAVVVLLGMFRPEALYGVRKDTQMEEDLKRAQATVETTKKENTELRKELSRAEEQNRTLQAENSQLKESISRINSVRTRVVTILEGRGSAFLSEIMRGLNIYDFRGPAYDEAMAVLGSLIEEGKVQNDGKISGRYRLTQR